MRPNLMFVLATALLAALAACNSDLAGVRRPVYPDAADVHTEFLEGMFQRCDECGAGTLGAERRAEIAYGVAREIFEKYGLTPMSAQEVRAALNRGYKMATQDPVALIQEALPPDQFAWWDRFAGEATVEDARAVYAKICKEIGEPKQGTMLEDLVQISLSSAEFWAAKRGREEPLVQEGRMQNGWLKKLLRFSVTVAADALGGAAAGTGTGGNPVVAGVVGGLCSYAVDDMLFGED